jgi:hypothetical protein
MKINTLADLKVAIDHPYRASEYLTDGTSIFDVVDDENVNQALIDGYEWDELEYMVLWEGQTIETEDGTLIEPVYQD